MFVETAKRALLFYATNLPYHRGKWHVIERALRSFGIESTDASGIFECERQGLKWRLDTRCAVQRRLYYHGALDRYDEREFFSRIRPGAVMLDIGSYFGYYGLLSAKHGAKSFAFEPAGANFADLKRQCELNSELPISIFQIAMSNQVGVSRMSVAAASQRGTGRIEADAGSDGKTSGATESVTTTTLDTFVAEHNLERIDAVKLDVEGAEMMVLAGGAKAFARWKPMLLIEFNPPCLQRFGVEPEKLLSTLQEMGYRLRRASHSGLAPFAGLLPSERYCNLLCLAE